MKLIMTLVTQPSFKFHIGIIWDSLINLGKLKALSVIEFTSAGSLTKLP